MRYISATIGVTALAVLVMITHFRLGLTESTYAQVAELCMWSLIAFIFSRTILKKRTAGREPLLSFRELVITASLVFAAIGSNVGVQAIQREAFGRVYTSSYADPEPAPGRAVAEAPPSVAEKIADMAIAVSAEEVLSRWLTLGALLMLMSPGWALFLSSLLFALQHTVIPFVGGMPEIGWLRIAPTFAIGLFSGVAFLRSGLTAAILVHLTANMVGLFAENNTYIADGVIFGSAAVAMIVLPLMLIFERLRRPVLRRQIRFNLSPTKS